MKQNSENNIKIIFDTDIGGDCDDAGALALIHRLCDKGEAELLAVTYCHNNLYAAGCIDTINTFFGRRVPVGINYNIALNAEDRGVYAAELCENYPNSYPAELHGTENGPEDTVKLWRKILSAADDKSVTIAATGTLHSMLYFIMSEPDEISPLSGKELLEQKVNRTVVMGGRFFESWPMPIYESGDPTHHLMTWEYNIRGSGYETAKAVFENWSGELILASYEIGTYIVSMVNYGKRADKNDPVAKAYQLFTGDNGRCSWDLTAALEAIRPGVYWSLHEFGEIYVDEELVTHWRRNKNKRHSYLLLKADYAEICSEIDALIDGK